MLAVCPEADSLALQVLHTLPLQVLGSEPTFPVDIYIAAPVKVAKCHAGTRLTKTNQDATAVVLVALQAWPPLEAGKGACLEDLASLVAGAAGNWEVEMVAVDAVGVGQDVEMVSSALLARCQQHEIGGNAQTSNSMPRQV
eukprot:Skav205302  [mRNA]  locus=scaffold3444:12754:13176:- [translate_table: standard]